MQPVVGTAGPLRYARRDYPYPIAIISRKANFNGQNCDAAKQIGLLGGESSAGLIAA